MEKYTRREEHDKSGLPLVVMDMPRFGGVCPFVRPVTGCQVYRDRPATCRYYPVGQGLLITEEGLDEFYFLVKEPHCKGFESDQEWTVQSWKEDQGADYYDEMNKDWKAMMLRRSSQGKPDIDERTQNLFYMVMYDLDQFRRFIFQSRFLEVLKVDDDTRQRIYEDDLELLKFGYDYLKMVLKIKDADDVKLKDEEKIRTHGIEIHPGRHQVTIDGNPLELTATEFKILHFLAKRPGWVFTRYQIVDGIRGPNYPVTERAVDVQVVALLRRKLGERGDAIETVSGVGYRVSE